MNDLLSSHKQMIAKPIGHRRFNKLMNGAATGQGEREERVEEHVLDADLGRCFEQLDPDVLNLFDREQHAVGPG